MVFYIYFDLKSSINHFWFMLYLINIYLHPLFFYLYIIQEGVCHNSQTAAGLMSSINPKHPVLLYTWYGLYFILPNFFSHFCGTSLLILGSYWSLNEFNWGGLWSFDFIENSLIFQYIFFIYLYHYSFLHKNFIHQYRFNVILTLVTFLKFNSVNSLHSFTSNNSGFYYNMLIISLTTYFHFKLYTQIYLFLYSLDSFQVSSWVYVTSIWLTIIYLSLRSHKILIYSIILNIYNIFCLLDVPSLLERGTIIYYLFGENHCTNISFSRNIFIKGSGQKQLIFNPVLNSFTSYLLITYKSSFY